MAPSDAPRGQPNRLAACSSPYLLQHAYNPVDWYPWGEEALERARREDRPIFLSIGYSACHWCHVMERECFEDAEIARMLNQDFVCIKVDREERPDLDEVYMRAVQALTGAGGWPLNVFLTPGLKPFYGGTYWPPCDRGAQRGFPHVLRSVLDAYRDRRSEVERSAGQAVDAIRRSMEAPTEVGSLSEAVLEAALKALSAAFDLRETGFGTGAKFPQAPVLEWLLRLYGSTGNDRPRYMLAQTLEAMARGGLCDQLGGGFHRYTVDSRWRIPHFEKMLYDNAQLIGLYADASRALGSQEFLTAAIDAADYLLRDMCSPEGAFYSAQDADSDGVEGRYYAWSFDEITDCLGTYEGAIVARYYGACTAGNWENGLTVLHRPRPLSALAEEFKLKEADAAELIHRSRRALLQRRRRRAAPAVDTKVLTDWNALTVSALVRLHRASREGAYLDAARRCAAFLLDQLRPDGRLMHSWREGKAQVGGFLLDHAALGAALLDLHEATFEESYLREAAHLGATIISDFYDRPEGIFRDTGPQSEQLVTPVRAVSDQPVPSGNSVACDLLLRLGDLQQKRDYVDAAGGLLERHAGLMRQSASACCGLLAAALRYLLRPHECVIVGVGLSGAQPLVETLDEFYLPNLIRAGAAGEGAAGLAQQFPLLGGKVAIDASATAYLCADGACRQPVQEPEALREQLRALLPKS